MTTAFVYDPIYKKHATGRHPENVNRLDAILSVLRHSDTLWAGLEKLTPRQASEDDVLRCHSGYLIERLRDLCQRGERHVDADTIISPESYEVALYASGASVTAVDAVFGEGVQNAFALVRPPGHHATPTQAMGFCLFNNAAIGARYAQARYGVENVLIVDWDVHHGNGTQDIFYSDPSVFYLSTHQSPYYPGTGDADETGKGKGEDTTLNVPLREGTSAREHREAFSEALRIAERRLPPDLIIISAGFDSRRGDPLGGLMLEDADFREMTLEVMDMANRRAGDRVFSLLEGGYNLETLGETVKAHIEALAS